jgi:hypothetical protein
LTTKEAIHQLVDTLDEETAAAVLDYAQAIADGLRPVGWGIAGSDVQPRPLEWLKLSRPTSEDDPLWNIVGMVGDEYDGPTDVSANHDKYLAEAYADLHEDDDSAADKVRKFTLDDPLWRLVGIGRTAEPTNIANEKDDYLADAIDVRRP